MTQGNGMFLLIVGLMLTLLGVGGIEGSLDNTGLFTGLLISLLGCAVMGCGVLIIKQTDEGY
jgi:hypothetical protein